MNRILQITCAIICILTLNFCTSYHTPAPVVELNSHKDYREIKRGSLKAKKYIVKKGDTLYSIAWESGQDFREIANVNDIPAPYDIYPGQELSLSASNTRRSEKRASKTGPTSKNQANQVVDPPKKQAYGGPISKRKASAPDLPDKVARWVWPTYGKVVGTFSLADEGNKGIDISNKRGTPILAAAAGKVVYRGNALRGYGNLVIIKHDESFLSAYAFNQNIKVTEQQWVKAGEQIAQMGSNDAGQVLLHFEIRHKGKSVNPLRYLPKR
ncbi:MAG: peptidoglycan DD-metalloendopeptidase family protein [Aestuariibacter sp.]